METNKTSVFSGLLWAFLDQFSSKGITIIVSIILGRILLPEDFGVMGLLYIFPAIALELVDGGLASSLIRNQDTDYKDNSTIFFTNVVLGVFLYTIFYWIAPWISSFYEISSLTLIIRVYCLIFVINSFSNIHMTLLMKNLKFRKIMLLNIPGILLGSIAAIYLASSGYGVWSIVYMQIIIQFITAVLLWFQGGDIRFYFSFTILKKHYDFGIKVMLTGIINAVFRNLSNSVIGKFYNVKDLGYFDRAKTLSMYPSYVFVGILSRVFYPVFSKIDDDNELGNAYKSVLNVSFYCSAFTLILLISVAEPFFSVVLGEKWLNSVPYFQILCLVSMLHPLQTFNLNILKVKGLSTKLLKVEVLNRLIGVIALVVGIYFNITTLTYLLLLSELISFYNNTNATQKYHNYTFFNQIKDFFPTIIISFISFIVVYFFKYFVNLQSNLLELFVFSLIFVIVYILMSFITNNKNFFYLLNLLKTRGRFSQ